MDLLDGLNDAQKEAVETINGPILILAGAGSGKTKTLTHRIAYLIKEHDVWPSNILAVTFTNKAAREMRDRLARLIGQKNERLFMPWMGTFHSICVKLLRIDGEVIGIEKQFVIYDEDDRQSLIKQAMKSLSITDKDIKPKAVSSIISNAKNQMVLCDEFEDTATYPFQQKVAKIYKKYESLKKKAKALDFDDLLIETVRLLRDNEKIRRKWQDHFRFVLIDEYQDTNKAQYQIVKLLINKDKNVCVVGDDWQSIYSWRGADYTNILNFEHDFKGAKIIKLEQNYRSTGNILDAAGNVIKKNANRTDKKLWTDKGQGAPVQVHNCFDEADEAQLVASRILSYTGLGVRKYDDYAILYRTNAQSYVLERAMLQARIPYQIVGGVRFYDRKEIKDILAYLRLAYQPSDIISFQRIVNVPTRGVGAVSVDKFLSYISENNLDIITGLSQVEDTSITGKAKAGLASFGKVLSDISKKVNDDTPASLIESLIDKIGYKDYLMDGTVQAEDRLENVGSLISDAKLFVSLSDFLEEAALMSSADTSNDEEKVTLMTMHSAKGLEFPVVFIVGMEEGILPHARVFDGGQDDIEEERRLAYVGMTRAREELHLSYASSRMQFGQRTYNPVSRFIEDMSDTEKTKEHIDDYEVVSDYEEYNQMPIFQAGDRVRSASFGMGEIQSVNGYNVTVKFDHGYTKNLNLEYARLEKCD